MNKTTSQKIVKLKKILDTYVGQLTTKDDDGRYVKENKKFKDTKEFITYLRESDSRTFDGLEIDFIIKWLTKGEQKKARTILHQLNLNGRTDEIIVKGRTAKVKYQ